jgi:hypothetical protein
MEIRLKMPCPVCVEDGNFTTASYWKHATHACGGNGGNLMVSDSAIVRCADPNCQRTWHITSARWGCPGHSHNQNQLEYKQASYSVTLETLRYSCSSMRSEAGQQFYDRLLRNI